MSSTTKVSYLIVLKNISTTTFLVVKTFYFRSYYTLLQNYEHHFYIIFNV